MKKSKMRKINIKWSHHFILILALGIFACKGNSNRAQQTSPSKSKAVFTELIKPLEGTWKGKIYTYSDPRGQVDEAAQPKDFSPKLIIARPTRTEQVTDITETYISDGEFSQRVKVVEKQKGKQIYTNHGFRKVEDGIIVNSINKLTGTEKRIGYKDAENNLNWTREERQPQLLEFFKHIRKEDKIRVIGWGYYEGDDLTKAPRIWYLGDLRKVEPTK